MEINATFLGQAVAFLIFAFVCMKYVWPPLINAIEKRQKEISDGLAAAEKAKKNLELANNSAKETLRQAKAEAQKIIEDANRQRSAMLDRASEEANAERQKILDRAKTEIELERNRVREELRQQIAEVAVAGAEKILQQKVSLQSDEAMLNRIMDKL